MSDKLAEALKEHTEAMDRASKIAYLSVMANQHLMMSRTPTTSVFGSYGFGGVNADWRQIVPRNPRRARITFMAQNLSFYFANSNTIVDVTTLIGWQNVQFNGGIPVSLLTFSGGVPVIVETTDSIFVASLTGAGSNVELAGTLNWVEEIYSDISANPFNTTKDEAFSNAGELQRLPHKVSEVVGNIHGEFTREGVR